MNEDKFRQTEAPKQKKWPYQRRTTPIGNPPKGMWYDPSIKESNEDTEKPTLRDALHHFSQNPDELGKPGHLSMTDSTVEFANGSILQFSEVVARYSESMPIKDMDKGKGVEKGFFDSPVDVGKDPKGDFPSAMWMPKGTEDMNVSPNEHAASLDKKAYMSVQRGSAYVQRILDIEDIEYDDQIRAILQEPSADPYKKLDRITARVREMLDNWPEDEDLQIKSIDWDAPEINEGQLMKMIDDAEDLRANSGLGLSKLDKEAKFWPSLGGQDVKHGDHIDVYEGHDTEDGSKWYECPKGSGNSRWEKGSKSQKRASALDHESLVNALNTFLQAQNIEYWHNSLFEDIMESFKEEYNANMGKYPADNVVENQAVELSDQNETWWFENYGDAEIENWLYNLQGIDTIEALTETYPDIVKYYNNMTHRVSLLKLYNYLKPKIKRQKIASKTTLAIKPEETFWYEDQDGKVVFKGVPDDASLLESGLYQNSVSPVVVHSICTKDGGEIMHGESTINCIEPVVLHLCNHQGWKLTDAIVAVANTCERCINILIEQTTGELYERRNTVGTHCKHCVEIDPEYNIQYLSKTNKRAEEEFITEESKEEIASTAGPEYISALKHYFDAVHNQHPKDRAIEYAVNEMKKQDIVISPTKLLELTGLYLI